MEIKMEKLFNLYYAQMLPRGGKKITNKIKKDRKRT